MDPLSGPSILRNGSSPADNVDANTRKGCKRESNNCPHKDIAKGDAGLENVKDLEDCMRDERSSLMESVFILSCYRPRPNERSNDFVK